MYSSYNRGSTTPEPPIGYSPESSYEERSSLSMTGHESTLSLDDQTLPQHHLQQQHRQQHRQGDMGEFSHNNNNPRSPVTPDPNQPLLPKSRQHSQSNLPSQFISSPLNPNPNPSVSPSTSPSPFGSRSRTPSMRNLSRIPSEETQILMSGSNNSRNRGSMILWRLASEEDGVSVHSNAPLVAPEKRFSTHSIKSTSQMSYTEDSKYPSTRPLSGFIAYAYDPLEDPDGDMDDFDEGPAKLRRRGGGGPGGRGEEKYGGAGRKKEKYVSRRDGCNWRGVLNVGFLTILVLGVVALFTVFPIVRTIGNQPIIQKITGNVQINETGQVPVLPNLPQLVDRDTPDNVKTRTGWDNKPYSLVFSDEFNTPNRTFLSGDDPFWEAVDLWYWPTSDMEWYDPRQITTRDGHLVITMANVTNHNLSYRSGMLQSWNKFCFTGGYIEVSMSLPGANSDASGYWPGAWIMGNLGRPGFGASTDGMWPYSYDSCDIGTFPNQTYADKSGPISNFNISEGRSKWNFDLSWLPGQRLSSCTCPGEDHPGPKTGTSGYGGFTGRGAPEIDILEAEKNKKGPGGQVSQSAQFAPFNADYQANYAGMTIYNPELTIRNSYNGSAVQQAITCLTTLPDDVFQGAGGNFKTFGFEYFADPQDRENAFITWWSDQAWSYSMTAATVGADPISQISARIVPEEPMSIILNLGMSSGFQTVDLTTLGFPAELLIDYVRVYQRDGEQNVGCDPANRPTAQYIQDHIKAYTDPNITSWAGNFPQPKNGNLTGGC